MIRNNQFIKRKIGTQFVIVAVGEATKRFNGMISINETGSFIWDQLERDMTMDELAAAMAAEYEVEAETARADAAQFLKTLKEVGALAEHG